MLISRGKRLRTEMPETIYLVPELCRLIGLTDNQRNNLPLIRALAEHVNVEPVQYIEKVNKFCKRLTTQQQIMHNLKKWKLKLCEKLVTFSGRTLSSEKLLVGDNKTYTVGHDACWNLSTSIEVMFSCAEFNDWLIITPKEFHVDVQNLANVLNGPNHGIRWELPPPRIVQIRDDRPVTYLEQLDNVITCLKPRLILCVVTNNNTDRYAAIKKKCSIEKGLPTQVS